MVNCIEGVYWQNMNYAHVRIDVVIVDHASSKIYIDRITMHEAETMFTVIVVKSVQWSLII